MTRIADASIDAAMARALELAARGPAGGANPRVGCVLLRPDGSVLAEGWHRGAGTPHAEADALARLAPGDATGATAVVTLEPCNHTGRTGPCAGALLDAGVARVVYAASDPNPVATGGGARLRDAGIDVEHGLRADRSTGLNRVWLESLRLGRPVVTVKWASSLDGRVAAADGTSRWVTGPVSRADVHRRRADAGAIVVGTGTLLADDPALTARGEVDLLPHQPIPVVLGRRPVPADAAVRAHPRALVTDDGRNLPALLARLHAMDVRHVFVEGGPAVASAFLAAGLADEILVYLAPTLLGGPRLATTDIGVDTIGHQRRLVVSHVEQLGDDLLVIARPRPAQDAQKDG